MTPKPSTIEAFLGDLTDDRHGTVNGYGNLKCRCERCRYAWSLWMKEYYHRRGGRTMAEYLAEVMRHGMSRYRAGCRCDVCRAASAASKRRHRAKYPERYRAIYREAKRRQKASA